MVVSELVEYKLFCNRELISAGWSLVSSFGQILLLTNSAIGTFDVSKEKSAVFDKVMQNANKQLGGAGKKYKQLGVPGKKYQTQI